MKLMETAVVLKFSALTANLIAKCKDHKIPVWGGEGIKFSPKLEIFNLCQLV